MSGTYRVTNVSDARTWQRIADTVNQTGLDAGVGRCDDGRAEGKRVADRLNLHPPFLEKARHAFANHGFGHVDAACNLPERHPAIFAEHVHDGAVRWV